eukprot:GSMAST32.ASY1.ANO1.1317.1 assembled CDS
MAELPFMATEEILMACVKAGGCRQQLHEAIRTHSLAASERVKSEGAQNDLLNRISQDPLFSAVHHRLDDLLDPSLFIGSCVEQTEDFLRDHLHPIINTKENVRVLSIQTSDELQV